MRRLRPLQLFPYAGFADRRDERGAARYRTSKGTLQFQSISLCGCIGEKIVKARVWRMSRGRLASRSLDTEGIFPEIRVDFASDA